jgi:hypothetical protein
MDTELLVDSQIADGQSLIERLILDNFDVSVAFWVKASEDGSWQLYIASPNVVLGKSGEAYQKVYYSLDAISVSTISTLDINLLDDESPIAVAAIELRDRLPAKIPTRYRGKRLGTLSVNEVYIYQELEIPVRQSFLVKYVRQEQTNEWVATTRKREYYRGHKAKGAISYSTAQWMGDQPGNEKFALVYVMVEVGPGLDESAIILNPIMMIHLAEQAQLTADEMFKEKHPDASITHEALALSVH